MLFLVLLVAIVLAFHPHAYVFEAHGTGVVTRPSRCVRGGLGAFATRSFGVGDVVEVCPAVFDRDEGYSFGAMDAYMFSTNSKTHAVAFGNCSLVNHSSRRPNVGWTHDRRAKTITLHAIRSINAGDELLHNYGKDYWKGVGRPRPCVP